MTYNRKKQSKNLIDDWAYIKRANNVTKGLSDTACKILSSVRYQIKKYGEAILTHEELTKLTGRKVHQNCNLVKQLGFVQNIEFSRSLTRNNKKYNNAYIFTDNENTDKILENPEEYFSNFAKENSQQTAKKFAANSEKIRSNSQSLYIYNKKEIKKNDNHDNQHDQFSSFEDFSEDVDTQESKIATHEVTENSEKRLAKEEYQYSPQANEETVAFVERTESLKATQNITSYYQKTKETVGKDGETYQSPYLSHFRFSDAILLEAIRRSSKRHYTPSRVWVIIRNILEKTPDKMIFGGRQGVINYLVKAINGEKDYEYEYKYPPTREEKALSMAEAEKAEQVELAKRYELIFQGKIKSISQAERYYG